MDATVARVRIGAMTAWDSEPTLTSEELDTLVELAQRADADGRAPWDADWSGTYDLNAAAAEGWRWKAARAASKFDVTTDGQTVIRSQIIDHCQEMAEMYRKKIVAHVPVYGTLTTHYTRAQEV
jgi:hypothetical protein